jgi:hypothetical protein
VKGNGTVSLVVDENSEEISVIQRHYMSIGSRKKKLSRREDKGHIITKTADRVHISVCWNCASQNTGREEQELVDQTAGTANAFLKCLVP